MVLQMKVEAANFRKKVKKFDYCGLTASEQNFKISEGGELIDPPGPNRVNGMSMQFH